MRRLKRAVAIVICVCGYSAAAMASCADIRATCNRSFNLDMRACGNYTDAQAQRCYQRAHEQLAYCVRASGC
jgi:hypothetical protein